MSKNSTIDTIFKTGLEGQEFDHAEALWQRMEPQLLQQQKKRDRKKYLLLLLLVAAGSALTTYVLTDKGSKATGQNLPADRPAQSGSNPASAITDTDNAANGNTASTGIWQTGAGTANGTTSLLTTGNTANSYNGNRHLISGTSRATTRIRITNAPATGPDAEVKEISVEETEIPLTTTERLEVSIADKDVVSQIDIEPLAAEQKPETKNELAVLNTDKKGTDKTMAKTSPHAAEKRKKVLNPLPNKVQLELAAGIDPFRGGTNGGRYALVLMRIPLNNKANVLLGAGYNKHGMSENYKIAGKQSTLTRDADARLQGLAMLQFPILYEQPIPKSRFIARIGITPVYIMEANVVNVSNTFNGSVIPFRSFTLDDVNRFSVLFTPALQYRLTNKLSAEIRGNYGLTGLVKNSYINQSSENNNFKSLQVGVMFRLGKK